MEFENYKKKISLNYYFQTPFKQDIKYIHIS